MARATWAISSEDEREVPGLRPKTPGFHPEDRIASLHKEIKETQKTLWRQIQEITRLEDEIKRGD